MKTRLALLGVLALGTGVVTLSRVPGGMAGAPSSTYAASHITAARPVHVLSGMSVFAARGLRARARFTDPTHYGSVPATIVAIRDNHCLSFTTTLAADALTFMSQKPGQPNDPRLAPCTPTANDFSVEWSSVPTQAQNLALVRVLGTLASNDPTISLAQADPVIRAAVQAAQ